MKTRSFPQRLLPLLVMGVLLISLSACGGDTDTSSNTQDDATSTSSQTGGLSEAELENGIGPIESLTLPEGIDAALVAQGEEVFNSKCAACHKLEERYVGPPLGTVLGHRTPAYVMNMILNPDEMVKNHPEAKALLAQFLTPMPNQNLTEDEARAVLEFLRANQEDEGEDEAEEDSENH